VPTEVHEHFDADGVLTGTTVVTRESAWDDTTRQRAIDLYRYENDLCRCGCGRPASESYNPQAVYKVDHFVCSAGRAIEQVRRRDQEQAKKDKKPEGWNDGRHYYAEPVTGGNDG
jgi:hypothetical protein